MLLWTTTFGTRSAGRSCGLLLLAAGLRLYLYLISAGRTLVDYYFLSLFCTPTCAHQVQVSFTISLGNTKGIQRGYAAREARRGGIWFGGPSSVSLLGNTKGTDSRARFPAPRIPREPGITSCKGGIFLRGGSAGVARGGGIFLEGSCDEGCNFVF